MAPRLMSNALGGNTSGKPTAGPSSEPTESGLIGIFRVGVRRVLGVHRSGWIKLLVAALRGEDLPLPERLVYAPLPRVAPGLTLMANLLGPIPPPCIPTLVRGLRGSPIILSSVSPKERTLPLNKQTGPVLQALSAGFSGLPLSFVALCIRHSDLTSRDIPALTILCVSFDRLLSRSSLLPSPSLLLVPRRFMPGSLPPRT